VTLDSNHLHNGGCPPTNTVSSRPRTRERVNGSCGQLKPQWTGRPRGLARSQKGFLIPSSKTRIAAASIAAALAPICILAAPSLAQATTSIDFAANASGAAVPTGWQAFSPSFYYANPNGANMLTVFYSGASAGDVVDLDDEQLGAPVPLGSPSTAGIDGTGSFTFASSEVNQNGDLIELTDTTASNATSDQFALEFQPQPQANDEGPVIDGSGNPRADSEIVSVSGAVPDEPVELTVNGTLDSSLTTDADDGGNASFNLTGLTAGYNTVQAVSEDSGGTPADSTTFAFSTYPIVDGNYTGWNFANTTEPTVTLDGVAPGATINVYANDNTGAPSTQLISGTDYSYTPGANNTGTVTFHTDVDSTYGYAFTQVDGPSGGIESDTNSVPYLTISLDTAAPTTGSDFSGSLTNETQPTFYASSDGNDYDYMDLEFTLRQNGQTVATSAPISSQTGSWQPPTLADGTYTLTAVTVDSFGELGTTASTPLTFTVDNTPPAAPTFTNVSNGASLTTTMPTITVQTDAGDSVVLCDGGNWCDQQTADGSGVATFLVGTDYGTAALAAGQQTLTAQSFDELYNASPDTSITVSVPAPAATPAPTPTTTTTTTPTPTPAPASTQPTTKQVTSSLNSALGTLKGKDASTAEIAKSGGATLTFKAPSAGTVTIEWYATVKGKKVLIGSATKTVGAGGTAKIKVKLNPAGKKLLKGSKDSVKITQSGGFKPTGGKQSTTSKKLSLKR
jgi:large repetitive protein